MLKFLAFSLIFTTVSAEVGADLAEAFLDVDIAEESDAEDTSTASCSNALWGQCGGEGWTGSTCCPAGSTCTFDNQWWSGCNENAISPTPGSSAASGCAAELAQCGGQGWTGATCCDAGLECKYDNEWWSQCEPSGSSTASSACAAEYEQCGANGWTGPTCCEAGLECKYDNEWWSQCEKVKTEVTCVPPPDECTGVPAIDAVLKASDVGCKIGLNSASTLYSWKGFCDGLKAFNAISGNPKLFLGNSTAQGLVNIASLLAQCMWETGGVANPAPGSGLGKSFSTCDESNYRGWANASCTQRDDGERYDSLNDQSWACKVDKQMSMTAVTYVQSYADGPMKCEPGTITEACCWWGRGAIQTTGPNNYGNLQQKVISKIPSLSDVDLCANPEAMCEKEQANWIGAIFFWSNDVQGAMWAQQKDHFDSSLAKFVNNGFDRASAKYEGADFAQGCGNVVNNGWWTSTSHGEEGRLQNFDEIVKMFTAAGMTASM